MKPCTLTETEIVATGLNHVGFPSKGRSKTWDAIRLLQFTLVFGVESYAINLLFQDLCEKHPKLAEIVWKSSFHDKTLSLLGQTRCCKDKRLCQS